MTFSSKSKIYKHYYKYNNNTGSYNIHAPVILFSVCAIAYAVEPPNECPMIEISSKSGVIVGLNNF